MMRPVSKSFLAMAVISVAVASAGARAPMQGQKYQVVKACSLLTLAEVKKLAPWPAHMDQFAKGEEEALGTTGSACEYATFRVQVLMFYPTYFDSLRKAGIALEKITGVGEEAYVRDNKGNFAELAAKVGPHAVTVQLNIGPGKTYASSKPTVIEIGKAYAAKLR